VWSRDVTVIFGPVPSRRFGRSLGINHIPPKVCSYACVYCQAGRTLRRTMERQVFDPPDDIVSEVRRKAAEVERAGDRFDVVTFVPNGEPTLDRNLGAAIELLRPLGAETVVITNGSLVWREDVREDLRRADVVSLKVDAVRARTWRKVNRPARGLDLDEILDGLLRFARDFEGRLLTETMLVAGVNDDPEGLEELARFLGELRPAMAYLSVPTRPPVESWVRMPDEAVVTHAWLALSPHVNAVECLTGYEGSDVACAGGVEESILGTTSVHPLREEALKVVLERAGASRSVVERLLKEGSLAEVTHEGHRYYVRRFPRQERGA